MVKQNYYDEIKIKIENLIQDQKYQEAYDLCREELEMPYIPRNFEIELINLFKQVNAILLDKKANINVNWTLNQIEEILLNPFDEEIHLVAFQYLKDQNIRKILPTLKKYLMNSLYRNETKVHLLFLMKEQEINEPIKIKKTNGIFEINPFKMIKYENNKSVLQIIEILNSYLYSQNPSLYNICLFVLQNYFYAVFPDFLLAENDDVNLAAAIILKGHQLFSENLSYEELQNILFDQKFEKSQIEKYLSIISREQIV